MKYTLQIDEFEGPMDLLIDLIKKREMNIYDIEIHILAADFLAYIEKMGSLDLDLSTDFLLMAAYLLKVKSQTLVPKICYEEEVEEEDPRQELVSKILEYEKMKEKSMDLQKRSQYEDKAIYRKQADFSHFDKNTLLKEVKLEDLVDSFYSVLGKFQRQEQARVELEKIPAQDFSFSEAKKNLHEFLRGKEGIVFSELIAKSNSRNEAITYFLIILEMIKTHRIIACQEKNSSHIFLRLVGSDADE